MKRKKQLKNIPVGDIIIIPPMIHYPVRVIKL